MWLSVGSIPKYSQIKVNIIIIFSGLGGTGTVRANRLGPVPITDKKKAEKSFARGEMETTFTEDISMTVWRDTRPVYVASNIHQQSPVSKVMICLMLT